MTPTTTELATYSPTGPAGDGSPKSILDRMIDPLSEVLGGLLVASASLQASAEEGSRRAAEAAQAVTGAMAGARQLAGVVLELRRVLTTGVGHV